MSDEDNTRLMPSNDLDLNLMLTDSLWGSNLISKDLKDKLTRYYLSKDEKGQPKITMESYWGLLNFYTRDMRLANLSKWDGELQYCRYYIDLANDYLQSGMIKPFLISLSRAVSVMETSQSKDGFFRKISNTLRQEHYNQNLEPPKKGFFGGKKSNEGGLG